MSDISVRIGLDKLIGEGKQIEVVDVDGIGSKKAEPVSDKSELWLRFGGFMDLELTVGQWRELQATVNARIEQFETIRAEKAERRRAYDEWKASRATGEPIDIVTYISETAESAVSA